MFSLVYRSRFDDKRPRHRAAHLRYVRSFISTWQFPNLSNIIDNFLIFLMLALKLISIQKNLKARPQLKVIPFHPSCSFRNLDDE